MWTGKIRLQDLTIMAWTWLLRHTVHEYRHTSKNALYAPISSGTEACTMPKARRVKGNTESRGSEFFILHCHVLPQQLAFCFCPICVRDTTMRHTFSTRGWKNWPVVFSGCYWATEIIASIMRLRATFLLTSLENSIARNNFDFDRFVIRFILGFDKFSRHVTIHFFTFTFVKVTHRVVKTLFYDNGLIYIVNAQMFRRRSAGGRQTYLWCRKNFNEGLINYFSGTNFCLNWMQINWKKSTGSSAGREFGKKGK